MSDLLSVFQKGAKVWVPNPYPSVASSGGPDACDLDVDAVYRNAWMPAAASLRPLWVPAEVVSVTVPEISSSATADWTGGAEAYVLTLLFPRLALQLPLTDLLPMNPDSGLDDCADFTFLHDAALQYSVACRALENRWMTRAGPQLLLSVNPCRTAVDSDGVSLFDPLSMARYRCRLLPRLLESVQPSMRAGLLLPPHLYEIAETALDAATAPGAPASASQSIILLGESGSGKSEAAKHTLQYLVCASAFSAEGALPRQPRLEDLASAVTALRAEADAAAAAGSTIRAGSGLPLLDPRGRPSCELLARPDVASARTDAELRSGPLGSYLNPWLSHAHPKAFPPLLSSGSSLGTVGTGASGVASGGSDARQQQYMFLLPGGVARSPHDYAAVAAAGGPPEAVSQAQLLSGRGVSDGPLNASARIGLRLSRLDRAVLAVQSVLDGFGSASTPANAHSSRFSRVNRLYFNSGLAVVGAHVSAGLLEKHRVTWATPAGAAPWPTGAFEPDLDGSAVGAAAIAGLPLGRNFHVFYRLLAGANRTLRTDLSLGTLGDYSILTGKGVGGNSSGSFGASLGGASVNGGGFTMFNAASADSSASSGSPLRPVPPAAVATGSVTDAEEFGVLCRSLSELGFLLPAQTEIWRVVSFILMLGNTRITEAAAGFSTAGETGGAVLSNEREVKRAAELLGVDPVLFAQLTVSKQAVDVPGAPAAKAATAWTAKKVGEARCGIESLLQLIYERLFSWLVSALNGALAEAGGAAFSALLAPAPGSDGRAWTPPACIAVADVAGLEGACSAEDAGTQLADYTSLSAGTHAGGLLPLTPSSSAVASASALTGYNSGLEACVRGLPTLLHNYAAERAHELFVASVFRSEKAIYATEGIDSTGVVFNDNAPVLDTLADGRVGLLTACLDEACSFPRSTDAAVMTKAATMHRRNPTVFVRPGMQAAGADGNAVPLQPVAAGGADASGMLFAIRHSGGTVLYSGAGFLASCRPRVDSDIIALLASSTVSLVAALFGPGGSSLASAAQAPTPWDAAAILSAPAPSSGDLASSSASTHQQYAAATWMDGAERLLSPLAVAQQQYIRCLRPNAALQSKRVDPGLLHAQLGGSGALHAVALRHSGFTHRTTFADFFARYVLLLSRHTPTLRYPPPPGIPLRDLCSQLLNRIIEEHASLFGSVDVQRAAQFGTSRVFLRRHLAEALDVLREDRVAEMDRRALLVQAYWRGHAVRSRLRTIWEGVRRFQAVWRTLHARQGWLVHVRAATTISAAVRCRVGRRRYMTQRVSAVLMQAWGRRVIARLRFLRMRKGMQALHAVARGFTVRVHVMRLLAAATAIQSAARRFLARAQASRLRNAAAASLQASWKGYRYRMENEEVLQSLFLMRVQRVRRRAASKIAAQWHGWLVRSQFLRLRSAASVAQRWSRAVLARLQFLFARSALLRMQALARGYLARDVARRLRVLNAVGDELWRVQLLREEEALVAAGKAAERAAFSFIAASGDQPASDSSSTGPSAASEAGFAAGTDAVAVSEVLSVDVTVDISSFFPGSLAGAVANLERSLRLRGYAVPGADGSSASNAASGALYVPSARLVGVALGASHALALTDAGHVLSWGFGDRGQCGHGKPGRENAPRIVAGLISDAHWRHAAATAGLLSGEDAVFDASRLLPTLRVRMIACGAEHSLALTDTGAVWAFGGNKRGQLGLGLNAAASSALPVRVLLPVAANSGLGGENEPIRVVEVCSGAHFSVALTASGTVYTWGAAEFAGQGVPGAVAVVESAGASAAPERPADVLLPTLLKDFPPPSRSAASGSSANSATKRTIRHIAAGPESTVAVTTDGDVWTWGDGSHGRLGLGEDVYRRPAAVSSDRVNSGGAVEDWEYFVGRFRHRYVPCLVEGMAAYEKHSRIVAVAAGWRHTLAVSSTGRVFVWGSNSHGQLGVGCVGEVPEEVLRLHDMPVPTLPLALNSPAAASTGTATSQDRSSETVIDPSQDAADAAARVAVNRYPNGSYAPRPYIALPVLMGGVLASRHAASIAASGRGSFAVTDAGSLWAWGLAGPALGGGCHGMPGITAALLQPAQSRGEAVPVESSVDGVLRQGAANSNGSPAQVNIGWGSVPGRSVRSVASASSSGSVSLALLSYLQAPITVNDLLAAALSRTSGAGAASNSTAVVASVAPPFGITAPGPAAAVSGNGLLQMTLALLAEVGAAACISAAQAPALANATRLALTQAPPEGAAPIDGGERVSMSPLKPRGSITSDVSTSAAIDAEARLRLQVGLGGGRRVIAAVARAAASSYGGSPAQPGGAAKQPAARPGLSALGMRQALLEVLGHLAAAAGHAQTAAAAAAQVPVVASDQQSQQLHGHTPKGLTAARQALHLSSPVPLSAGVEPRSAVAIAAARAAAIATVSASPARLTAVSSGLGRARAALGLDPRPQQQQLLLLGSLQDAPSDSPRSKTVAALVARAVMDDDAAPEAQEVAGAAPPISTPEGPKTPRSTSPLPGGDSGSVQGPVSPWLLADRLAIMLAATMAHAAETAGTCGVPVESLLPPQPQLVRVLKAVLRLGAELTLHPRASSALLAMPPERARRLTLQQLRVLVARLRSREGISGAASKTALSLSPSKLHSPLLTPSSAVAQAISTVVESAAVRSATLVRVAEYEDEADRSGTASSSRFKKGPWAPPQSIDDSLVRAAPATVQSISASHNRSNLHILLHFRRGLLFSVARVLASTFRASHRHHRWAGSSGPRAMLLDSKPQNQRIGASAAPGLPQHATASQAGTSSTLPRKGDSTEIADDFSEDIGTLPSPSVRSLLRAPTSPAKGTSTSLSLTRGGSDAPSNQGRLLYAPGGVNAGWSIPRWWRIDALPPAPRLSREQQKQLSIDASVSASFETGRVSDEFLERPQPAATTAAVALSAAAAAATFAVMAPNIPPAQTAGSGSPNTQRDDPGLASQVKALQAQLAAIKRRNDDLAMRMRIGAL